MKIASVFTCAVLFSLAASVAADARPAKVSWVSGKGQRCDTACERGGKSAISSGTYKNGEAFFVCRANANGEGSRAGYNLGPSWDNVCVVGWGGGEHGLTPYSCLCK